MKSAVSRLHRRPRDAIKNSCDISQANKTIIDHRFPRRGQGTFSHKKWIINFLCNVHRDGNKNILKCIKLWMKVKIMFSHPPHR